MNGPIAYINESELHKLTDDLKDHLKAEGFEHIVTVDIERETFVVPVGNKGRQTATYKKKKFEKWEIIKGMKVFTDEVELFVCESWPALEDESYVWIRESDCLETSGKDK